MKQSAFARAMKTLAALTGFATALLAVLSCRFGQDWLLSAAISTGTTFYHFAMRLLAGRIVPRFFRSGALYKSRWFRPLPFEPALHAALKVKKWKDRMPTYDPASFSLKSNTLTQIVRAGCVAETVHEVIVLLSFLPIFFSRFWGALPVFLITSVLAALFDCCFILMQRYNRPRLVRILDKMEAKVP